jgi:hypothetical protein
MLLKFSFFILFFFVFILSANFAHKTFAQTTNCQTNDRNQGLISGLNISGMFGNLSGQCVLDPKAAYAVFKVPTYDELKSLYYTQSKITSKISVTTISSPIGCPGGTALLKGLNLTASHTLVTINCTNTILDDATAVNTFALPGSNKIAIIFADGNLFINSNFNYGGPSYGTVLIVKGDVYISPTVTNINAVIISQGSIYTASQPPALTTGYVSGTQQLTVNGSLISINSVDTTKKIYFNRFLSDNTRPAEVVRFDSKYLVILRGLMTQVYSIQRELSPNELPSQLPQPTVRPSGASTTTNQGSTLGNPFKVFTIYSLINNLKI